MKKAKLITSSAVVMTMVMSSIVPAFAYSKEETVYRLEKDKRKLEKNKWFRKNNSCF